jgi:hypothetical protein
MFGDGIAGEVVEATAGSLERSNIPGGSRRSNIPEGFPAASMFRQ